MAGEAHKRARSGTGSSGGTPPAGLLARSRDLLLASLAAGAFYWVLIDTVDLPELYALGVAALLAGLGFEVARERNVSEPAFRAPWLRRAGRVFARVPADVVRVVAVIWAQLARPQDERGVFRARSFRHGAETDPRDAGRRTLAQAFGSLAPNTIVVGIDPDSDLILVHELMHSGGAESIDALELG